MNIKEAKDFVAMQVVAPDVLKIGGRNWKLECTYMTKGEAQASAEYLDSYKLFKYQNGYALYERSY